VEASICELCGWMMVSIAWIVAFLKALPNILLTCIQEVVGNKTQNLTGITTLSGFFYLKNSLTENMLFISNQPIA
jgi:hypothetical protein